MRQKTLPETNKRCKYRHSKQNCRSFIPRRSLEGAAVHQVSQTQLEMSFCVSPSSPCPYSAVCWGWLICSAIVTSVSLYYQSSMEVHWYFHVGLLSKVNAADLISPRNPSPFLSSWSSSFFLSPSSVLCSLVKEPQKVIDFFYYNLHSLRNVFSAVSTSNEFM